MPLVVAAPIPAALSAAPAATNQRASQAQPAAKRKRKRPRVKGKKRVVLTAGHLPHQKTLRNGRVRPFDMNVPEQQPDKPPPLSRSQKQFAALLSAAAQPTSARNTNKPANKPTQRREGEVRIKPGETQQQFLERVKQNTRKQMLTIARSHNRQRIKKRAYYERREQRMLRRKKKRSGQLSDSDEEQISDTERVTTAPGVNLSQLPLYWQRIVRNNGRPVSNKKRTRQQQQPTVAFGEQAQRPPKLGKIVIRHGQRKP